MRSDLEEQTFYRNGVIPVLGLYVTLEVVLQRSNIPLMVAR